MTIRYPIFLTLMFQLSMLMSQEFPELSSLDNSDVLFLQISRDIQDFYQWQAGSGSQPSLSIYQYRVQERDNIFSLAARLNLPQSSIATLNRLGNPQLPSPGTIILIPNVPGIFIPADPQSDFEKLLRERLEVSPGNPSSYNFTLPSTGMEWDFVIAEDFTSVERRVFLNVLFQDPLPNSKVSSRYGLRRSPITGKMQFHFGLDLAAPVHSPVRSIAEGRVLSTGSDEVYGNYVLIGHSNSFESFYTHLGKIDVQENDRVSAGQRIAELGLTGLLTGPHLHIEIFYLGNNRDPQLYIRKNE